MEENSAIEAPVIHKPKRKRKPSLQNQLQQVHNKLHRITVIADEAITILDEIGISITAIEDLKKKLKEM